MALVLFLSVLSFFTAYANALSDASSMIQGAAPVGERNLFMTQGLGVTSILLQTALMMGVALFAIQRWRLPFGALTVLLTVSSALTVSVHGDWQFLPLAVLSGLAADGLLSWWRPSAARPQALRGFAFSVPVIFYVLYFTTLALTGGLWWTVHLWAGTVVMAGLVGWLLSYAYVPPAMRPSA